LTDFKSTWIYWYNIPGGNANITNSVSHDASANTNSGSLEVWSPFAGASSQNVFFGTFANNIGNGYDFSIKANVTLYTNITFDILVDSNTVPDGAGNFGTIQVGFINSSYGFVQCYSGQTVPGSATNSWVHMTFPIDPTVNGATTIPGIAMSVTSYGAYKNSRTFWIDNVQMHITPGPPPPPPLVSSTITPAVNGLAMTATDGNGQYNRYNVATAPTTGFTFVGQPSVTYSWTNKTWPDSTTAQQWQQQLFLVGGTPGQYDQAVDWNMPNILWFTVQGNSDGSGYLQFRAKTNLPGGNGMIFNTETNILINTNGWPVEPLGQITATTTLGKWSVTIAQDTNITITTPDGTSTNLVIPPEWAALFNEPMTLCLGDQPNNASGYGQSQVFSSFSVAGNSSPFADNFEADTVLNTNYWRVLSNDPNGTQLVPAGSFGWLAWTIPDDGFSPQTAGYIGGPSSSWVDISGTLIKNNGKRNVLVPNAALQAVNQNYFRLIKRDFNGLQVLLPGETAAPGTLTGKTGTPTATDTATLVNVTVNAVDTNGWYLISGVADNIGISSSDTSAILPNNANMVNGTVTLQILFQTTGSQTVTATNTSTLVPNGTSSSITVN